jgi:hypothetical protein
VAQVWWALRRGERTVFETPLAAATPFAVTVTIRPPLTETEPRPDLLMKSVLDGVVRCQLIRGILAMPPATSSGLDWPCTRKQREKKLAASAVREVT